MHRLDARADPRAAHRVRRLRLEWPGHRPVRRVHQRDRRAGWQVSGLAIRDVWQRAPRRPRRGNGQSAARAGDADGGGTSKSKKRLSDASAPVIALAGTASSDSLRTRPLSLRGLGSIWTSADPMTTTPKPISIGRRSPLPFLPGYGINSRLARASSLAACALAAYWAVRWRSRPGRSRRSGADTERHAHQAATIHDSGCLAGPDRRGAL